MRRPEPVRGRSRKTALVLAVPDAETIVADFNRRFLPSFVARRIPPQVALEPHLAIGQTDEAIDVAHLAALRGGP